MGSVRGRFRPWRLENPEKFILDYNRRIVAGQRRVFIFLHTTPATSAWRTREVQVFFSTREVPDPKLEAKVKGTFGEFSCGSLSPGAKRRIQKIIW